MTSRRHPWSVLLSFLLLSCAGQIPPSGGPVDTTPPLVRRSVPDSGATRVTDRTIELEFSKYVERRSVEDAVFISPYSGTPQFSWSGRFVTVAIEDSLKSNITYVMTVGTDVKDVHAGNRMARAFTLAFSTGDSIDRGEISGRVYDQKLDGVMVFAYRITGINADTLDPSHVRPDYVIQTSADGRFRMTHLRWGVYRLLAVRDEYRNYMYDRQVDAFGVWRNDVVLSSETPAVSLVDFRLAYEDTTKPFVSTAKPVGPREILVRMSESVDSLDISGQCFMVSDTLSGRNVPLLGVVQNLFQPSDIWLHTGVPLDSGRTYRVAVNHLFDLSGNPLDTLHADAVLTSTGEPDTLRPIVSCAVRDSARDVGVDGPIFLHSSQPIFEHPGSAFVQLIDSNKAPVAVLVKWRGGTGIRLDLERTLQSAAWYDLRVVLDSIRGASVRTYKDSVMHIRFRTGDNRSTGSIEGTVALKGNRDQPVRITARNIDAGSSVRREVRIPRPGPFDLQKVPEGHYTLDAYAETDSSGLYQFGLPKPFTPSAPFGVSTDTVRVRARWGVQGVRIEVR